MLPRTYLKPQSLIVYEIEDAELHTNQLQGLTCWPLEQDDNKNARLTNVPGLTECEGVKTPPSLEENKCEHIPIVNSLITISIVQNDISQQYYNSEWHVQLVLTSLQANKTMLRK